MTDSLTTRRLIKRCAVFVLAALLCLALYFSYTVLYARLMDETQQRSLERLRFVASIIEKQPNLLKNNALMAIAQDQQVRLSYISAIGRVLGDSSLPGADVEQLDSHSDRLEFLLAARHGYGSAVRRSSTLNSDTVYTILRLYDGNYLRIAVPFEQIHTSIIRHFMFLLGLSAGIIALAVLAFLAERHVFRQDLRELSQAVNAIAKGNFTRPVSALGWADLEPLAGDIRILAETIRKALTELTDKSCQLQTIFDSIKEGIAIFDDTGGIRASNAGFIGFFPQCRLENYPQAIACIPIPRLQLAVERVIKGLAPDAYSFRASGVHGEHLLVSLYEPAMPAPDVRIVLIVQDITKLMQLEQAQVDFVANVSHELRTPLTAIKGYAEALSEKRYSEEEGRSFAQKIERHADMLHSLIEELLSLARIDDMGADLDTEHSTLEECAQKARQLVVDGGKRDREIVIENRAGESCLLAVNKALFVQAIRNLLENACTYSPQETKVMVSLWREDAFGFVRVSDYGAGIPKDAQQRIFERFYRLEKQRSGSHSGLGLAIAKQIVERFGGRIWVESPAQSASTSFTIQMPLAKI